MVSDRVLNLQVFLKIYKSSSILVQCISLNFFDEFGCHIFGRIDITFTTELLLEKPILNCSSIVTSLLSFVFFYRREE